MKIRILEMTNNAVDLIYSACRECYSDESIIENYPLDVSDDKKEKLIRHVINSGHHSVLEHVYFTFAVEDVSRVMVQQLTRHRLSSYSMRSQRYLTKYSDDLDVIIPPSIVKNEKVFSEYMDLIGQINEKYKKWTEEENIPGEDARYIFSNGKKTALIFTMNCRSLMNFFSERLCSNAQWEIRNMAKEMLKLCSENLSIVFKDYGAKCKQLGYCNESKQRTCGRYPLKNEILLFHSINEDKSFFKKILKLFKKNN